MGRKMIVLMLDLLYAPSSYGVIVEAERKKQRKISCKSDLMNFL
jgi:hypothetical protein